MCYSVSALTELSGTLVDTLQTIGQEVPAEKVIHLWEGIKRQHDRVLSFCDHGTPSIAYQSDSAILRSSWTITPAVVSAAREPISAVWRVPELLRSRESRLQSLSRTCDQPLLRSEPLSTNRHPRGILVSGAASVLWAECSTTSILSVRSESRQSEQTDQD